MSLLIPLYVHPAEDPGAWHRLITAADRTYAVVLNPANGPGTGPDQAFTAVADALRTAAPGCSATSTPATARGTRPRSPPTRAGTGSGTRSTAASWTG